MDIVKTLHEESKPRFWSPIQETHRRWKEGCLQHFHPTGYLWDDDFILFCSQVAQMCSINSKIWKKMCRISVKKKKNTFCIQIFSSTNMELIGCAVLLLGQIVYLHKYLNYILSDHHLSGEILMPTTIKTFFYWTSWITSYFVPVLSLLNMQEQILSELAERLAFDLYVICMVAILLKVVLFLNQELSLLNNTSCLQNSREIKI